MLLTAENQVNHKDFLAIFVILQKSQSIFVPPLENIFKKIKQEIDRAKDNVKFLKLLIEPCNELSSVATPADIPLKLPRIINIIRYIWLNSQFYNTPEYSTKLYRYVGNQIIDYCRRKIAVEAIFNGDSLNQIQMTDLSIDCCLYYKVIFEKISTLPENGSWTLNQSLIFNHIDSFIKRAYDLIEICHGITVFSTKHSTRTKLEFEGDRSEEFESTCQFIETTFEEGITKIQRISSSILNINDKSWTKQMQQFQEMTAHLDEMIDNLMLNVFTCVHNLDEGIYALACLHRFSNRANLKKSFERQVDAVWKLFGDEVTITNDEYAEDCENEDSPLPPNIRKAVYFHANRKRLMRLRELFEQNKWIPHSVDTPQILFFYNSVISKMQTEAQSLFDGWMQSLGIDTASKLNRLLVKRSLTHSGLFECNMDEYVLLIFKEARYFKQLGHAFPMHLTQFFGREPALAHTYHSVIDMIKSYNNILLSLSETERALLRPMTQICDKCIAPGALRLTWINEGADAYVSDCNRSIQELADFVKLYHHTNNEIANCCEKICEIVTVEIPKDKPRQLCEIEEIVQAHLDKQMANITLEIDNVRKFIKIIRIEMEDVEIVRFAQLN